MGDPDQQRFVLLAQRFEDVLHLGVHRHHSIREPLVSWDAKMLGLAAARSDAFEALLESLPFCIL